VQVYGITLPLLTTSSGEKFGKSMGNAVWLSPDKTSPYALYQYLFNTADPDVERMLRMLTFVGLGDIDATMRVHMVRAVFISPGSASRVFFGAYSFQAAVAKVYARESSAFHNSCAPPAIDSVKMFAT
jgi:tyrosyl-tRNA synthetase